jgi:hypothetical protein
VARRCLSHPEPVVPPLRPRLADQPSRFMQLEREVEHEYRSRMLASLQGKVDSVAAEARAMVPTCPGCGRPAVSAKIEFACSDMWKPCDGHNPPRLVGRGTLSRTVSTRSLLTRRRHRIQPRRTLRRQVRRAERHQHHQSSRQRHRESDPGRDAMRTAISPLRRAMP